MNELTRSMGQPDCYPFVLPYQAVGKLQFIHETIRAQRLRLAFLLTSFVEGAVQHRAQPTTCWIVH